VLAKNDTTYGAIDKKLKIVLPFIYQNLSNYNSEGYFIVKQQKKYGILNRNGEVLIPFNYNYIDSKMILGTVIFGKGNTYGLMDIKNNILIESGKYNHITVNAYNGFANVNVEAWQNGKKKIFSLSEIWKK
jgi:hypothetical protein